MTRPAQPSVAAAPGRVSRLEGAAPSSRGGLWVVVDQGVVSLANFAAPVLVGRHAAPDEFGLYVLGYSVYLFALGMAKALVWTPYTRRLAQLPADRQAFYTGSATAHLALFAVVVGLAIALIGSVALLRGAAPLGGLLLALAPCSAAMLLREHVRRVCLARLAFREVLWFDLLVSCLQVALLVWLALGGRATAVTTFGAFATTSLLAVAWLASQGERLALRWGAVVEDWRSNWSISKWLAGGAAPVLLGKEGYRWLLYAVTSAVELAKLGSAQIAVQVTNPVVIGVSNYLGPITAKLYAEQGIAGLWRHTVRTSLVTLGCIALFVGAVGLVGQPIIAALLPQASVGVTPLLLVTLTAGMLSEALLVPIEFASVNLGLGRLLFTTALVRLAINVTLGFTLVGLFGVIGIGVGLLASSLVSIVWQWVVFARETARA